MTIPGGTLVDRLRDWAQAAPDDLAFVFLADGETETASISSGALDRRARSIAAHLADRTVAGDRALLLIPAGLDFIAGFLGCLYAGIIAVPAYPPLRKRRDPRIEVLARDAGASLALTTGSVKSYLAEVSDADTAVRELELLSVDGLSDASSGAPTRDVRAEDLAYLQYTSGSTSDPKGVMIEHGNLLHNCSAIWRISELDADSISVSWLPPFHDMGLVTGIALPLFGGFPGVIMPPAAFLRKPIRWLRALSRYRGRFSGGPNSAYDWCVARTSAADREGLDLSSWNTAFTGAEPVRAHTIDAFTRTFAPYGFAATALAPAFGMAETTLMVSAATGPYEPRVAALTAAALEQGALRPAGAGDDPRMVVGCGPPAPEMTVAIVEPLTGLECPLDRIGEIWVSGPSVARGYWGKPRESHDAFENGLPRLPGATFLRTGDLGFLAGDQLFITGRIKDLIIIRGRNLYPDDVELTASRSHPSLPANAAVAFSLDAAAGEELVVVQGIGRREQATLDTEAVILAIRSAIVDEHEVEPAGILLTLSAAIPRTTSGKLARAECRRGYLAGSFQVLAAWRSPAPSNGHVRGFGRDDDNLCAWLKQELANRFYLDPESIDPDQKFTEYGLDSLTAMDLTAALDHWLGYSAGETVFWDYPTINLLAAHLTSGATEPRP